MLLHDQVIVDLSQPSPFFCSYCSPIFSLEETGLMAGQERHVVLSHLVLTLFLYPLKGNPLHDFLPFFGVNTLKRQKPVVTLREYFESSTYLVNQVI